MSATITNFTNNSTITSTSTDSQTFYLDNGNDTGKITHLTNKGNISGGIRIYGDSAINSLTNYGEMRGIWANGTQKITINNYGTIKTNQGSYQTTSGGNDKAVHFMFEASTGCISIENYKIKILESASEFNAFTSYSNKTDNKNSHLIIWKHGNGKFVEFKDDKSKLLLDVGDGFEFGAAYKIAKLVTDQNGDAFSDLNVDFSRLALSDEIKDLYSLTNSGDSFIIRLMNKITETPITAIYKTNIRTMNNFYLMSNSMIYPRKTQNLGKKNPSLLDSANHLKSYESFSYRNEAMNRRIQRQNKRNYNRKSQNLNTDSANQNNQNNPSLRASEYERGNLPYEKSLDSANHLKSYESFAYRNESQNRRIQRQNKRNYSRESLKAQNLKQPQNLNTDSANRTRESQNRTQNPHDYYFILTPFINHNLFFESGRYNLSGFDYGFLTAFSTRVAESNSLGAHFMMSYGSLGDSKDKDLSIKSLNLNVGVNYKLDLIWDMYLKARGDVFYFSNALDSLTIKNIKPSNLGFGASVAFGKDFDFGKGGVLGIEAGLDYKALQSSTISLHDNIYQKALYNLIYADVGVNYSKYFGNFGVNAGLGIKGNITANKLAKSQIRISAFNKSVDMVLDNDMFLGYTNLSASYMLNHKNFDMEFSLAYYGNFGDRAISNAGGFEWRVVW